LPNRVKLDVQGDIYTFPINPIEYLNKDFEEHVTIPTIGGNSARVSPFSDSRERIMRWSNIPNRTPYWTLIPTLRGAIGVTGVRINLQDMNVGGFLDWWSPIVINNVRKTFVGGKGESGALNHLSYDLELRFVYV
jgi:hypothetical protein